MSGSVRADHDNFFFAIAEQICPVRTRFEKVGRTARTGLIIYKQVIDL